MKQFKILLFLMVMCMAATCFLSGTVASYSTTADVDYTANIAKWSFTVNDKDITTATDLVIDVTDTMTVTEYGDVNADLDVAAGLLAPGTQGSFVIALENTSNVAARYGIVFTVENTAGIPLEFSTDGSTWKGSIDEIVASDATQLAPNGTKDITVSWRWAFDNGNDTKDTEIGVAAATTKLVVKATITAAQAD
ncbi:MAG: hypothetical protein IKC59_03430 [Clostridia bacterium]|nr:hypothetical protein [Clostridia bacterium]